MISSSRFRVDAEKILCYPLGLVFGGDFFGFNLEPGTTGYAVLKCWIVVMH